MDWIVHGGRKESDTTEQLSLHVLSWVQSNHMIPSKWKTLPVVRERSLASVFLFSLESRKGPQAKECSWPLEIGKCKKIDSL